MGSCSVHRVCFSNPSSSFYLKPLLFPSEPDVTLSFPPLQINRTGILVCGCAGSYCCWFSNSSMSLPAPSPQNAASCPRLVATDVPPSPSGMAQDFTLSLNNVQEVRQTTEPHLERVQKNMHVVRMSGMKQRTYGVFASSRVKHRWMFVCRDSGQ